MSSTKKTSEEKNPCKIKRCSKAITPQISSKKLDKAKVTTRPKNPEISVVNVIEQISLLLRTEIRKEEQKKASGE
jgi:hypothetical protein